MYVPLCAPANDFCNLYSYLFSQHELFSEPVLHKWGGILLLGRPRAICSEDEDGSTAPHICNGPFQARREPCQ